MYDGNWDGKRIAIGSLDWLLDGRICPMRSGDPDETSSVGSAESEDRDKEMPSSVRLVVQFVPHSRNRRSFHHVDSTMAGLISARNSVSHYEKAR